MKVLSVASECVPFVKTGGLADVVGALPGVMAQAGVEMRVMLPGYPAVMAAIGKGEGVLHDDDLFGGPGRLVSAQAAGIDLLVLDAPHLFDRDGSLYMGPGGQDWPDNPERFAALSWMAARVAAEGVGTWRPDLVHGHDWQAGFAPYYLKKRGADVPTVFTIHNIAFHGTAAADRLGALRLDPADFVQDGGFEFWGQIDALKAGLLWSDRITTVSPSYARELTRPEFGAGLHGVIEARAGDLAGILNGIDTEIWNPATDPHIVARYKSPRGKAKNKKALRQEFALPEAGGPLCVVVSRLTEQKGLDLLIDALPALVDRGGQLVLLGTGEAALEAAFRDAAHHENVAVHIGYDEAMSHRLIAGADAILVPSRFEPCGLTQLYALRYGTIPLVALTGGLADTVIPANPAALSKGVATGIQITPPTAHALALGLIDLCTLYQDKTTWARMQRNAMAQPVGWAASAAAYARLYHEVADPA
ncbi:Glycogen synthase, ADP-glucose transglucosylase [Roseibacterium elongatum DSM 19469]|uniref:Glycogen synthase n=1 Tax=Roseicyclus elongatus DSM 19469 TaxID=1294273 RepID=W8S2X9_9RHOB|nr:glycogen synthase GlgA [Roseibacterium elongatum]AHM04542.1 Glycogen synthase, ADP-glucose transglucosylase [Roseibacterium elongatum DSM 19469]